MKLFFEPPPKTGNEALDNWAQKVWQQFTRIEQVMRDQQKIYLQADFTTASTANSPVKTDSSGKVAQAQLESSYIDHDQLANTHNLTTDIDHDTITNTHNLTTDIDHAQITNLDYASSGHTGFAASTVSDEITQLVDANANVTVKSADNTAGSGDYLTVKAGTALLPAVLVSADGTETNIGILAAPKGDTQYFQVYGGSSQYKGARFVVYGRDHASVAGKAYLDFGGYDATGQIIFRHRLNSSFLTVFTMNYDGDLTLVGNVNTSSGKTYNIGGSPHGHALYLVTATPRVVTDTTTETATDGSIICNKGSAMTVNLLAATGSGRIRIVKNIGAGAVTVDANASETIDGDATQELTTYESIILHDYASGAWAII